MIKIRVINQNINKLISHCYTLECSDYINITDHSRSVVVDSQTTGTVLCDKYEIWSTNSRWIRFPITYKTRMPEYCPPKYACNTHAPGWLNGIHPAVEDEIVQSEVCFHWRNQWGDDDCCNWRVGISVRNCTTFFVYQPSYIITCSLRLCVGKLSHFHKQTDTFS